jgi:PIN domain nuclease of toxin-antitoxin system
MRYLLDTQIALWLFEGSEKLSQAAQDIIFDDKNEIYVSIVSAWEVAIKVSINKLDFEGGSGVFLSSIKIHDMNILGVKGEYVTSVEKLPYIHRDPFDRLLISTALVEGFAIITSDGNIQKHDVSWVW